MSIEQSIFQALITLGSSAHEVAGRLAAMGVTGRRDSPAECPLARYLAETLRRRARVGSRDVVVGNSPQPFALPPACQAFVEGFDEGRWPGLEEAAAHDSGCPNLSDTCLCER